MARFDLRAVCQNRNLWSMEDFEEITIRHSSGIKAARAKKLLDGAA